MHIISLLCLTSLRIINASDGKSCLFIEKYEAGNLKRQPTTIAYKMQILSAKQCKPHTSASHLRGPQKMNCYLNSNFSMIFEGNCRESMYTYRNINVQCPSCSSTDAGTTVAITCPSNTAVDNHDKPNDGSTSDSKFPDKNLRNACINSLICKHRTRTYDKQNANMNWLCEVVKQVDDRTMDSYVIPDYVFIIGGVAGVLLVICITAGVFLLRKSNRNEQEMPIATSGPDKQEKNHQVNFVNVPEGQNLLTAHAVYFDNRTDDKAIKLCPVQQPDIQTNKHESNTYSHLRTTTDDSDDMYDHTVRKAVCNTCDGDYGVAHIRITEDDYNVSGNYPHPLTNKEDPVYT